MHIAEHLLDAFSLQICN